MQDINERHAALLTLELLDEAAKGAGRESVIQEDVELVHNQCVFTTHTPVPAGHDKFPPALARKVLGDRDDFFGLEGVLYEGTTLNMTYLALRLSRYINGVAQKHGEVSRLMFAGYAIDAITNGVHASTWVSVPFQDLFDRYIPFWRQDNFSLRYALSIPGEELWDAHMQCKNQLMDFVNRETGAGMDEHILTIGFARRASTYKRGDLSGKLQYDPGGHDDIRGRYLAQHAGTAHGGFGNQWDEGGPERRAQFECAGRLVDRRTHRRADRLVHRGFDPGKKIRTGHPLDKRPLPGL
jgi:starch phosphorylase